MPEFGLVFYNFPGHTLEQFARFAGAAGFTRAEIPVRYLWNEQDRGDYAEARATEVGELLRQHGLRPSAVSAGNDFLQPDDAALEAQLQRLRRVCRLARLAGTDVVRIDGGWTKPQVPPAQWFPLIVRALSAMKGFVEAEGYTLALDNHGTVTNDAYFQVRILEAVGSPRIGANLDTMNYRWAGHELPTVTQFYQVIAPWVRHVHMKDGRGSGKGYRGTVLGEGEIELDAAVRALQNAGYPGPWCVEYEGPAAEAEEGYRRGLAWLRAHVRP